MPGRRPRSEIRDRRKDKGIGPHPAGQPVRACSAHQPVIAGAPGQLILTSTAKQPVDARPAEQFVVPLSTFKRIIAPIAEHQVIASITLCTILIAAKIETVIARQCPAKQLVVVLRARSACRPVELGPRDRDSGDVEMVVIVLAIDRSGLEKARDRTRNDLAPAIGAQAMPGNHVEEVKPGHVILDHLEVLVGPPENLQILVIIESGIAPIKFVEVHLLLIKGKKGLNSCHF